MKITKEQIEKLSKSEIIELMLVMLEVLGDKVKSNVPEKTIGEWINEFPEPYKTKALNSAYESTLDEPAGTASLALQHAFEWATSNDGKKYWDDFYFILFDKENNI